MRGDDVKPLPKDPVRAMIVKNFPPAPAGMKKQYVPGSQTVKYVPKTPKELLRPLRPKP